jgi:predicted amidophosphoribosyltransferase
MADVAATNSTSARRPSGVTCPLNDNTTTSQMKTCPTCQKEIDDGARTCPGCGKSFTTFGGVFIAILIGLILGGFFFLR